jgi:uncharacterized protein (DUF58 family)
VTGTGLTPQGTTAVVAGVVLFASGVALGWPELCVVGVACLAAVAVALAFVAVRPTLSVTRLTSPTRVQAGDSAVCVLEVENTGRRPAPASTLIDRVGDRPVRLAVAGAPPGVVRRPNHTIATTRRGRVRLGPVEASRSDPLGLLRWSQPAGAEDVLWVHPRVLPLRPLPAGIVLDVEGTLSDAALRGTITFSSLREYEPGDDLRQVHWASTARTGTLMVRDLRDTSQPHVTVALDTRPRLWTEAAFEAAVGIAASVVRAGEREATPAVLRITGGGERAAGLEGATSTLDRLAAVGLGDATRPDDLMLDLERAPAGGVLVVVTGNVDAAAVPAFGSLRRRFAPVVVVRVAEGSAPRLSRRRGLVVVDAPSAAAFAGSWAALVGGSR